MAKWISLKKAASKYSVGVGDIRFWAATKEIAAVPVGKTLIVDDESIQEFLSRHQIPPTKEYMQIQMTIFENQTVICEACTELMEMQKVEIEKLERKVALLEKISDSAEDSNNRILDIAQRSR